jgi:hypothetical protein
VQLGGRLRRGRYRFRRALYPAALERSGLRSVISRNPQTGDHAYSAIRAKSSLFTFRDDRFPRLIAQPGKSVIIPVAGLRGPGRWAPDRAGETLIFVCDLVWV